MDSALTFAHFGFTYKAQAEPTLFDINLAVRRGEKICILGPSGSGKSTLANCINGLIPHAFPGRMTGSLSVMGEDARGLDIFGLSKRVGTVLQDTDSQFVGLSAGEDIAFAAENDMVPVDEMRRRVRAAAELVQIGDFLSKQPQELSGGQKQRVSMAGVLLDEVDILLFDEPLANLDPAAGKQAIELIDGLHRKTGKTILIVEHRLEDVLHRPVDRIVIMDGGRIIADDVPAEVLSSGILGRTGIREPLYLSALRYAGISFGPADHPEDLQRISFDAGALQAWDAGMADGEAGERAAPLLEIRDLSFSYEGAPSGGTGGADAGPALDHVSFTVNRGDCLALVGKNGAGKSSLAALICGFCRHGPGTIFFDGRDMAELSIKERADRAGCVMQNPNHMISFPLIYDETALGLRARGMAEGEIRDRVHEIFRVCGLYSFRNWPVSALSFGQKKRLTIASILVLGPSLLILDEPTAGQDFRHYSEIMEFLLDLNRGQGITLLLITHDMHLMLEYCNRAVVIAGGRIVAGGPVDGESLTPAAALTDDRIVEAASLKRTSLYDLALRAGIADPRRFAGRFIRYDREMRARRRGAGGPAESVAGGGTAAPENRRPAGAEAP
ncbi:MAG: ABC transporter ATP-binding protein [Treponema sp.]|jgi:energy-coupling factor transport system ATP-binding protein|nr:ABC transporter ATP-binding protein [Treponema sp.]